MNGKRAHARYCCSPMVLAVFLMMLLVTSPVHALFGGKVDEFSADMVEIDPGGNIVHTAKMYVTEDALRIDNLIGADMGGDAPPDLTLLVLKEQDSTYIYNHDKKLVYQGPVEEKDMVPGYEAMGDVESEKILGKEKVSGYTCVKKEVTTHSEIMGMSMTDTLIVWENEDFQIPLRTMDEEGGVQEMRNIDEGAPPKKLFRPMTGYKKADNMMAVMGMDFSALMAEAGETTEEIPEAPEPDLENMDTDAAMEKMEQAMGDHMSPEEKQQFMEILSQAMNRAEQTQQGEGVCAELWHIVPKRSGDEVGYEMKTEGLMDVVLGTDSTLREVFDDYRVNLEKSGWEDGGSYIQGDSGMMNMRQGEKRVQIAAGEKPAGMEGDYNFYYNIQYSAPPQQ